MTDPTTAHENMATVQDAENSLQKYALLIEYDGKDFKKKKKQLNPPVRSIEEAVEKAKTME